MRSRLLLALLLLAPALARAQMITLEALQVPRPFGYARFEPGTRWEYEVYPVAFNWRTYRRTDTTRAADPWGDAAAQPAIERWTMVRTVMVQDSLPVSTLRIERLDADGTVERSAECTLAFREHPPTHGFVWVDLAFSGDSALCRPDGLADGAVARMYWPGRIGPPPDRSRPVVRAEPGGRLRYMGIAPRPTDVLIGSDLYTVEHPRYALDDSRVEFIPDTLTHYAGALIADSLGLVSAAAMTSAQGGEQWGVVRRLIAVEINGRRIGSGSLSEAVAAEAPVPVGLRPERFGIEAAYPNPFQDRLTLRLALPEAADVNVELFDVAGRLLVRMPLEQQEAGWVEARIDGSELASGVYLVRAATPGGRHAVIRVTHTR